MFCARVAHYISQGKPKFWFSNHLTIQPTVAEARGTVKVMPLAEMKSTPFLWLQALVPSSAYLTTNKASVIIGTIIQFG